MQCNFDTHKDSSSCHIYKHVEQEDTEGGIQALFSLTRPRTAYWHVLDVFHLRPGAEKMLHISIYALARPTTLRLLHEIATAKPVIVPNCIL
jgi:hypothetical protein